MKLNPLEFSCLKATDYSIPPQSVHWLYFSVSVNVRVCQCIVRNTVFYSYQGWTKKTQFCPPTTRTVLHSFVLPPVPRQLTPPVTLLGSYCTLTSTLVGQHSTARLSMILASSGSSSSTAAFHNRTEFGTCSRARKGQITRVPGRLLQLNKKCPPLSTPTPHILWVLW